MAIILLAEAKERLALGISTCWHCGVPLTDPVIFWSGPARQGSLALHPDCAERLAAGLAVEAGWAKKVVPSPSLPPRAPPPLAHRSSPSISVDGAEGGMTANHPGNSFKQRYPRRRAPFRRPQGSRDKPAPLAIRISGRL
jgi:hypothetical protein